MSLWMFLVLCSSVQKSDARSVSALANPHAVMKAVVGELFQIVKSTDGDYVSKLPSWICSTSTNKSVYEGIPLMSDLGPSIIFGHTIIQVAQNPKLTFHHQCKHRWPTILVLFSNRRHSSLSSCDRITLRYRASSIFNDELQLVEDTKNFNRFLSVLAQWPSQTYIKSRSAIVFLLGCGSIADPSISKLRLLEQQSYVNTLSIELNYPITSWMIADIKDISHSRRPRNSDLINKDQYSGSSMFYVYEKQQRQEWAQGRVVIEGSGPYDQPYESISAERLTTTSTVPSPSTVTDIPRIIESNTVPIIIKRLMNVTVVIGSKLYYQISPYTYRDVEDGYGDKMMLKVYIRSADMQTDYQVPSRVDNWVYFIAGQQVIVFQPGKKDRGKYNLVVCAYDSHKNRICDGTTVEVLKPGTVTKRSHPSAQSGVLWKYPLPPSWAAVIKTSKKESLELVGDSFSIFEWVSNSSTVNLITEASVSREHKIKIMTENKDTGRKVILLIVVTSVGHNAYISATSVQIIIRLSLLKSGKVPFEIINSLKKKLISSIVRYNHNIYSTPRDILVYKVLDGRNAFMSSLVHDRTITLSMVYTPKKSFAHPSSPPTCSEVVISHEMLQQIRQTLFESRSLWSVDYVKLEAVPGKCQQDLNPYKQSNIVTTTPSSFHQRSNDTVLSAWINRTINITVRNGFIFKKIIMDPFHPDYQLIDRMELLDENNLPTDDSSWVSLLSPDYALFGLPLLENVRSRPYEFRLNVVLRSRASQLVPVTISVDLFTPRFDHRFDIIISISETDSVAHRAPLTMDQLLISQTLSYRWQLVQTLGSYLQAGRCGSQCGMDIFTHSLFEQRMWLVTFSWSVVLNIADSLESPSALQPSSCNHANLTSIMNTLFISDPTTDYMVSLFGSSFYNVSARPSDSVTAALKAKNLGTPTLITTELLAPCLQSRHTTRPNTSHVPMSNITVFQGNIFVINLITPGITTQESNRRMLNSQIYCKNNSICNMRWLRLSRGGDVLYGLPLPLDIAETSDFVLKIQKNYEGNVKSEVPLRITVKPNPHIEEKSHLILMQLQLEKTEAQRDPDIRIKIVQLINQYLHPSCTIINGSEATSDSRPDIAKLLMSCEKAEDVILHSLDGSNKSDEITVTVKWSQKSFKANKVICQVSSIKSISQELFEKTSSRDINRELTRFFSNSGIGLIHNVHFCLYGQCMKTVHNQQFNSDICVHNSPNMDQVVLNSSSSTKVVLLALFLILVAIGCVCLGVYFVKRGLNDGDNTQEPKNSVKGPISSKKPKKLITQESSGINLANNSPSTPLLSPFVREDSKTTRNIESMFNADDNTGSYSFAASRAKSPEPEICSSPAANVTMCDVKLPNTTSNVIRNPAMMMGSRLNPYRNIPPQIK